MLSGRALAVAAFAALAVAPLALAQQMPSPQQCTATINAVVAQRNAAMDGEANMSAQFILQTGETNDLRKQVAELQKQITDLQKPKDAPEAKP